MINLKTKPTLHGSNIILRPFKDEDIIDLEICLKDPEVIRLTGSTPDYNRDEVVKWYNTRNNQENRLDLAIVEKLSNTVVGEAVVNEYDKEKHSMNYRILIGPKGRNMGYGTDATRLMMDYIFNNTDLKQITLNVYAFNPRAQKVYEKAGFIIESIDKDDLEFDGEKIDSINMVLTREKWLEII